MLLATYSVTEVAMNCGFATTSYFIKVFKVRYHETPKQFQLRQLNLR
ncbi:helix-turn-helix domain-containing protein [Staphylococcus arlettae]|nr:helix-turn-helix domain-containing protein [Staphylococcus arlettae]